VADEYSVTNSASTPITYTGEKLYQALSKMSEAESLLRKLEKRGYPPALLELLLNEPLRDRKFFQDKTNLENLKTKIAAGNKEAGITVDQDPEHGLYELSVKIKNYRHFRLSWQFFSMPEWLRLQEAFRTLSDFQSKLMIQENGNKQQVDNWKMLLKILQLSSKKGLSITRYKGLGEMDPEQLWETTMNPNARTLLQVKIEDAIQADRIFSTLMGEEVDPRKVFITDHALEVKNLDV
jgi:DNA gyrase subunit B